MKKILFALLVVLASCKRETKTECFNGGVSIREGECVCKPMHTPESMCAEHLYKAHNVGYVHGNLYWPASFGIGPNDSINGWVVIYDSKTEVRLYDNDKQWMGEGTLSEDGCSILWSPYNYYYSPYGPKSRFRGELKQ
jgi:hypothetical protein